jgi:hypothetical protein
VETSSSSQIRKLLQLISINVNGLNSPIKTHTLSDLIKKIRSKSLLSTRYTALWKKAHRMKEKGYKIMYK